jgi:hypothetical protein
LYDSSISSEINEPDWQPYNFRTFTFAKYDFSTKKIQTYSLNRDSIFIPVKYSKEDSDDYYKFNIHEKISAYEMDIDDNGDKEIVVGGFYMNNYYTKKINRFAYGWKVLSLDGKDLTTKFFKDSGFDRNTEILSHGLDIDDNAAGIEMIPGSWGNRNIGELGNYYKVVNGKFDKTFIRDLKLESGKKLDSSYLKNMELIKYPNYKKNRNALLMFDMNNLKRASILYQFNCSDINKPIFEKNQYKICGTDSAIVKLTNYSKSDSTTWYVNNKVMATNTDQLVFKSNDTFYVNKVDTNGCLKTSDVIVVLKYSTPTPPSISRDTANNLVSTSSFRNTWFKDGTLIADTSQKFKPTSPGSYTVKTSQDGCISAMSSPYYFLVTDIVQFNNGEFIKLTPNPFINNINIDFVVKGHQRLNIEVFSSSTGARVASRIGVTAGSRLTFNELNPGVYFVRVASLDLKVSHQFKMIKL